jgi:predicted Holliday junction resolvase-like endonuclease
MIGNAMVIVVFLVLILLIFHQRYEMAKMAERAEAREKDLLDRIMARNYETFVNAQVLKDEAKERRPLTAEEIYEAQQGMGIPL